MKKIAVIVAGGSGARMNNSTPKQFLFINGKPVLYYTLKAFLESYEDLKIILVLPEEHMGKGQEIIDGYFDNLRICIAAGGRTRFHSVQNGLRMVGDKEAIIFVHDGVRCLVSGELIRKCYESALEMGTAVPVIECPDSVRLVTAAGNKVIDRSKIKIVQTPQTFHSKILLPAFDIDYKEKFTDEASVVEAYGMNINLVEGESKNLKITNPFDLKLASLLLE